MQKTRMRRPSYNEALLQWRKSETGDSYETIAKRAGIALSAAWNIILGNTDPSVSTFIKLAIAMGLDPKQVLNRDLKTERQFRRAVIGAAR